MDNTLNTQEIGSRFAVVEDVFSERYRSLIQILDRITVQYGLPDHSDVNQQRYPWSKGLLSTPAFYAARMWEYPFALFSAELEPGMTCVDVGCGMTAFTLYLQNEAHCRTIGVDPDFFEKGVHYKGHGVSREFLQQTGLKVVQYGMEKIGLDSNSADRIFCLSVIEHLPREVARRGVQEMARILKPGGRAIWTVDVNLLSDLSRPLDLIWDSGLLPLGSFDLRWPKRRLGNFCDGRQPADVFGMVLVKEDYPLETQYSDPRDPSRPQTVSATRGATLRFSKIETLRTKDPLWRRGIGRIRSAARVLLKGQ